MERFDFDVLVVGGGPAGSVAGAYLARAGLRVLLAEKDHFPRFHIGESLMPASNPILQEIGAWEKIERAGFQRKYGAEFHVGNESAPGKRIEFSQGLAPGAEYTYQVERARFDALLFDHASELGCEALQGTKVTGAREIPGGYEATLLSEGGGGERTMRCAWIIDASGRDNHFSTPLKRTRDEAILAKRVAIYAHYRNVRRAEGRAAGNIVIVRHGDGWFWLIPLDAERTSVGLVTTVDSLRADGGRKPEAFFHETVADSIRLSRLLEGAEPVSKFHVTGDYSYRSRRFASRRMLLAGDAAGFLDPMFSTGVFLALFSAKLAAGEIVRAHARGQALSRWAQWRYTRRLGRSLGTFKQLVLAFYDNASFAVFMDRTPPLDLNRAVNSVVSGMSEPTWPVRWRYWLFLLTCWAQRRWPLVRPVNLDAAPAAAPTSDEAAGALASRSS